MNRTRSWWTRRGPAQRVGAIIAAVLAGGLLAGILSRTPESAAQEGPGAPASSPPATGTAPGGGTSPLPPGGGCDPGYAGCVPLVADVDCAGAGDGPVYVKGPIRVIRDDDYDLDPDHDGVACN